MPAGSAPAFTVIKATAPGDRRLQAGGSIPPVGSIPPKFSRLRFRDRSSCLPAGSGIVRTIQQPLARVEVGGTVTSAARILLVLLV